MTQPLEPRGASTPRLVPDQPARALARDGFGLGEWRVEPRQRRIVSGRVKKQLDPRLMDLLLFLACRPGACVSRTEILDLVWCDAVVSENTLTQAVSRLRRILGDDRRSPRYIETVSKTGYRLVAPVEWPAEREPAEVGALPRAIDEVSEPGGWRRPWPWILAAAVLAAGAGFLFRSTPPPTAPAPTIRPALTHVGQQFEPMLSPDGQHVAFAWRGPEQDGFDIWVQRLDSGEAVRLTHQAEDERAPSWSPDGLSLLYVSFSEAEQSCGIFQIPLIGGSPSRLLDCPPRLRSFDWSPDGASVAMSASEAPTEPRGIFLANLDTGDERRLTRPPPGVLGDRGPVFSPDGLQVAFSRRESEFRHLVMVVAIDGTGLRTLTSDSWGRLRGVEWSSDGRSLVFSSNRSGRFLLWRVGLEGGTPTRLPIEDDWVTQPSVARRGGRMIYRTFRDVVDLYSLPLAAPGIAGGEPERVVPSTRSERDPVWSPDGRTIAFLSDRSGTMELWSGDLAGTGLLRHTDFQGPRPESATWSPDGKSLIFDAAVDGHADLWSVERNGQRPRLLTNHPSNERNASFSRDGTLLYFASDRGGDWEIFRMPAAGGDPRQVTRDGAFFAAESLDGQFLLTSRPDRPGIWRRPVKGGESELVVDDLDLSDWGSWVAGRSGIYYLRRSPTTIVFQPFGGGEPLTVYEPPNQMPYLARDLSLSPDGTRLLFSSIGHSDDEVMLVDLPGL